MHLRSELGPVVIEFSPQMLCGITALVVQYREMYWFRHWTHIWNFVAQLFGGTREAILVDRRQNWTQWIDTYLSGMVFNVSVKHCEVTANLYEDQQNQGTVYIKSSPFFSLTAPAATLSVVSEKSSSATKISAFGFQMSFGKPFEFVNQFVQTAWKNLENGALSGFLKGYYAFYDTLCKKLQRKRDPKNLRIRLGKRGEKSEENISDSPDDSFSDDDGSSKGKISTSYSKPAVPVNAAKISKPVSSEAVSRKISSNTSFGSGGAGGGTTPVSILNRVSKPKLATKKSVRFDVNLIEKVKGGPTGNEKENPVPAADLVPVPGKVQKTFKQSSIPAELNYMMKTDVRPGHNK